MGKTIAGISGILLLALIDITLLNTSTGPMPHLESITVTNAIPIEVCPDDGDGDTWRTIQVYAVETADGASYQADPNIGSRLTNGRHQVIIRGHRITSLVADPF